ncbi:MAG: S-formylglutathione hydrolase [Halobacteriovoraceae bacterium]|nr:S-formylglutathione hydrolase [Halobacteriovoraceae bacterium]|tara:strand:- start:218657 stop:219484 length:828 start_codon:yes stop_codon:yes gene_type:complete
MSYTVLKKHKSFGGETIFCEHHSESTKTKMNFSAFLPKNIEEVESAVIWLSGLTCNEENFITKAGVQAHLAGTNTMVICPDTSPRGQNIPGEDDSYDFGSGASFYLNARTENYESSYQMYDYVVKDIVKLLREDFGIKKISIFGHSMGGHGALVCGIRDSDKFESVSAFSPIVNPVNCPWGQKAFKGYLGDDETKWKEYDAIELTKSGKKAKSKILIDQGTADEFLEKELLTQKFEEVCGEGVADINYREGYDHSYYFISTFLKGHIEFHLSHLE